MTVGSAIKEMRIQQGLTQAELATKADVSGSSITRIENDKPVERRIIALVCLALDTTLASIEAQVKLSGEK